MKFKNGDEYDGYWENNEINGNGIMIYNNGDKYNGEWINAIFINGIIQYNNGDEFKGKIENNNKQVKE